MWLHRLDLKWQGSLYGAPEALHENPSLDCPRWPDVSHPFVTVVVSRLAEDDFVVAARLAQLVALSDVMCRPKSQAEQSASVKLQALLAVVAGVPWVQLSAVTENALAWGQLSSRCSSFNRIPMSAVGRTSMIRSSLIATTNGADGKFLCCFAF